MKSVAAGLADGGRNELGATGPTSRSPGGGGRLGERVQERARGHRANLRITGGEGPPSLPHGRPVRRRSRSADASGPVVPARSRPLDQWREGCGSTDSTVDAVSPPLTSRAD